MLEESQSIRNRGLQNRGLSDLDQKRLREIDSALEKDDKAIKASKTDNYLVHRDRYNELMSNPTMRDEIDALAMAYSTSQGTRGRGVRALQAKGYNNSKQYAEALAQKYGLTKEQIDDIAKTYTNDKYNEQNQKIAENTEKFAEKHPVLGSVGSSLLGTTGSAVEGAYNTLAGLTNDDRNISRTFNTLKGGLRQGASNNFNSEVGKTVYNLGMGLGDLGIGVASGNAPLMMAGNTANDAFLTSMDNGADLRNASAYAVGAGVTDYLFNKIGLDKAKSLAVENLKSTGIRKALAQNAIAGAGEAGENVLQDVAQSFLDQLINGENSELQTAFANKIAEGKTEDEAFAEVAKEYGKQVAMSAGTGYLMGSAMQGVPTLVNNANAKLFNRDLDRNRANVWNEVEKFEQAQEEITPESVKTEIPENTALEEAKPEIITDENVNNADIDSNEYKYNVRENLIKQIHRMATEGLGENETLEVGATPSIYLKYGADQLPLRINQNDAYKIAYPDGYMGGKHNLGFDAIADLPYYLSDPDMLLKSDTQPNSIVAFISMEDEHGYPVMVALHLNKNGFIEPANQIASMYGKRDFDTWIESQKEKGNVLYTKQEGASSTNPGVQFPNASSKADPFVNSTVNPNGEVVNPEDASATTKSEVSTNDVDTSMPEPEHPLLLQRKALIERLNNEKMSISEMGDVQKQIKALDEQIKQEHPEWYEGNKFVGNNPTKTFNSLSEEQANELEMNLQHFAELSNEKKKLEAKVTGKGAAIANRMHFSTKIDQIDESLKGLRKTITNTAVKAGIVTPEEIANDPDLNKIATYIKHRNADIVAKARENLTKNGEQIKNEIISGRRTVDTDVAADESMLLLQGEQGELSTFERNGILRNLAMNGTKAGQFIQALKKYSNTKEGALVNATKVLVDETNAWTKRNKKAVKTNTDLAESLNLLGKQNNFTESDVNSEGYSEGESKGNAPRRRGDVTIRNESNEPRERKIGKNGKLAEALKLQGYDGTIDISKPKPTYNELRQSVKNTIDTEYSSISNQFSDSDIDYLTHMIEHNVSVNDLVDALNTKMATGTFGISDATQSEVNRLFEYAKQFDENDIKYVEAQAEAFRLLAEEISPKASPLEKFDAWRYMAMLGNPKTMLRNFIGNKMFSAITGVSNNLAAVMEAGTDAAVKGGKKVSNKLFNTDYDTSKGIQRTKTLINPFADRALLKATKADAYGKRGRQIEGSKYEKMDKDAIRRSRSVYDSKFMRLLEKAVDRGISDTKAVASKYSTSMAGYMKANGLTEADIQDSYRYDALKRESQNRLLSQDEVAEMESLRDTANKVEKARDFALKQAEYATFHEDNAIADVLSRFSRINAGTKVAVEGLIPFKKTPLNILRSGIEYSPLGALKSIAQTGKLIYENTGSRKGNLADTYEVKNPITHGMKEVNKTLASDVIQSWSQSLTGTGLAALGYYLVSKGILHSSTKDEKYQDTLEGKQNYSIEINGKTYTIDWAVPGTMPLLLGAEIKKAVDANALSDEKWYKNIDSLMGTADGLLEPLIETSMLQGIQNTLDSLSSKYDDEAGNATKAVNFVSTLGANYLSQAVPTLSGQITRTFDNTRRSTDTVNEGMLGGLEKQGRKVMNKTPLSVLNKPYINARGEQEQNAPYDNVLQRLAYQTLSPWYADEVDTRASDEVTRGAYNGIGENGKPVMNPDVFADWKSQKKLNGEKLTPEQMYEYREKGYSAREDALNALSNEDWFANTSPEIQTEVLRGLNNMADHVGSKAVDKTYTSGNEYFNAYNSGGLPSLLKEIEADVAKKEQKRGLDKAGLPSNEVTKELYDTNDRIGQQRYKEAMKIASQYGYDTLSKTEYQIYDKKGSVALSQELKNKKVAEELGVTNSKAFQESVKNGTSKQYADAYKAITSTKTGEDDLGNDTYLGYNDTTAKIYKDRGQQGLNDYATLKNNLGDSNSDADYISALNSSRMSKDDQAYFFVLHKGDSIAKSAPKDSTTHTFMWYLSKQKLDANHDGKLSKAEKSDKSNLIPYLKGMGYSDKDAQLATTWEYK